MTRRIRLEADVEGLPRPAERVERSDIGIGVDEGAIEPVAALEDRGRTGEAGAGERGGGGSRLSRPARMQALDPRAVLEELHHARREATGDAERRGQCNAIEALTHPRG